MALKVNILYSFCSVSWSRCDPGAAQGDHAAPPSGGSRPAPGRCHPGPRAPPRSPGVGKFAKGRLEEGNAVSAILFYLGSWGGCSR